jgi:hypothetical protein
MRADAAFLDLPLEGRSAGLRMQAGRVGVSAGGK